MPKMPIRLEFLYSSKSKVTSNVGYKVWNGLCGLHDIIGKLKDEIYGRNFAFILSF